MKRLFIPLLLLLLIRSASAEVTMFTNHFSVTFPDGWERQTADTFSDGSAVFTLAESEGGYSDAAFASFRRILLNRWLRAFPADVRVEDLPIADRVFGLISGEADGQDIYAAVTASDTASALLHIVGAESLEDFTRICRTVIPREDPGFIRLDGAEARLTGYAVSGERLLLYFTWRNFSPLASPFVVHFDVAAVQGGSALPPVLAMSQDAGTVIAQGAEISCSYAFDLLGSETITVTVADAEHTQEQIYTLPLEE